ncbi:hypothetical protein [Cobetia crustatorum]|uniref:hypothetical protein n=1 Tax=Cobetia crustatorum TaxID=553385 RepID=UPI0004BA48A4|nr:hypothetical protein [Cobetia crustatorum]
MSTESRTESDADMSSSSTQEDPILTAATEFSDKGSYAPPLSRSLAGSQVDTPPGGGWPSLKAVEKFIWQAHLPSRGTPV